MPPLIATRMQFEACKNGANRTSAHLITHVPQHTIEANVVQWQLKKQYIILFLAGHPHITTFGLWAHIFLSWVAYILTINSPLVEK